MVLPNLRNNDAKFHFFKALFTSFAMQRSTTMDCSDAETTPLSNVLLAMIRKIITRELLFDRDGFSAGSSTSSIPNLKGSRFADISHRAIDKATVYAAGVVATSADVSASKRSVSAGVLLRQRIVHVAVPVDR